MAEIITPTGAIAVINPASFESANELKKAIERELSVTGFGDIFKAVLTIDSSDAVEAALWPCLNKCLYKGEKIIKATFNDVGARKDYHTIAVECARINVGPFVESLSSQLSALGILKPKESPKSE